MAFIWLSGVIASALGISAGGGLAWFMKRIHGSVSFLYSLCGGLIIGLLFIEMIPKSIQLGGWVIFALGTATGVILYLCIHRVINMITLVTNTQRKVLLLRTGVLLTISIAMHNFPVGLALGAAIGTEIGKPMLLTILLHNIPEGVIIFTPLFLAGYGFFTWLVITAVLTVPVAIGSLLGLFITAEVPFLFAFMINLAISMIFIVAVKEMVWEAMKKSSIWYGLLVSLFGITLVYMYFTFIN
ncbi:ZIP family metal transporter [Ornithinibacillus sp. FSL M8-0202]|uniref:ZIP family metal transporter n=1 Tax=Ornithinibacillus sp. FSL M8-0202 TaxID=2921616 RepID=UPI0030D05DB7